MNNGSQGTQLAVNGFADVTIAADGKFTFTFAVPALGSNLLDLSYLGLTQLPPDAKILAVDDLRNENKGKRLEKTAEGNRQIIYFYMDRDATIQGNIEGMEVNIVLKTGWNEAIWTRDVSSIVSGHGDDSFKWRIRAPGEW